MIDVPEFGNSSKLGTRISCQRMKEESIENNIDGIEKTLEGNVSPIVNELVWTSYQYIAEHKKELDE